MTSYGMERPVDKHGNLDKAAAKRVVRAAASPVLAPSHVSHVYLPVLDPAHLLLHLAGTSSRLFMEGAL